MMYADWTLIKVDTLQVFNCDRCHKDKKSKTVVFKEEKAICNGCYGELKSKGEK